MMKNLLIIAVAFLLPFFAQAQTSQKIGHLNVNELLQVMPEMTTIQAQLQKHGKQLEQQFGNMQTELQTKMEQYYTNEETMSEAVATNLQMEIQQLQQRIQKFQVAAQEDVAKKEQTLLQPLLQKVQNAINAVAEENGYSYIMDTSSGVVVYTSESTNVMSLVKTELGI